MLKIRLLLLLIIACISGPVFADDDHLKARQLLEAGTILPLEQLLDQARLEHPGHVLEVKFEQENERYVYEIELVDDNGEVWEIEYDAQTGELIEKEQKE
jgi:uncharacterized membrane protein YkoI